MSKIMLVNVTHVEESRVAVLEDGVLAAYEIETINRASIKGNIYNAVVESVHPSLEAAFVRLAPDLKGFLPLDEVNFNLLPTRGEDRSQGKIGMHLHRGQKLMAQVVREPFGGKPPTVSTYFSLPGRFLVLMPGVTSAGISRKIEDEAQRDRLKRIVEELKPPEGFGLIVRTAGMGQTKAELQRDMRYLLRLWESIQRASSETEFPNPVYRERDLVIRTIRDHLSPDVSEVWIDSQETYERALEFVRDVMPSRAKILRLYNGDRPLFNKYNLEEQIETIYKRRVPLPSGGEIVIDGTEALTAIDVNSARSARKGDAEERALQTNLEAAAEIARQMRLRDLGGLLIIDFIDMAAARNRKKVEKAMRDAMRGDRARHDITRISKLGLMEISRQRLRAEKMAATYATCPTCDGYGLVKTVEAAALAALRKLQTRCSRGDLGTIRLTAPQEVSAWILNHKRDDLSQLERRHDITVEVVAGREMSRHECRIETFPRRKAEAPPPLTVLERPHPPLPPDPREIREAGVADGEPPRPEPPKAQDGETVPRRKRRRRRRKSAGRAEAAASGAGTPGEPVAAPEPPAGRVPETAPEAAREVPQPPAPGDAGAAGTGAAGSTGAAPGEGGTERKRKRRRRRRKSKSGSAREEGRKKEEGPRRGQAREEGAETVPVVPPGIRADELMPAAVAGSSRSRGRRGGGKR